MMMQFGPLELCDCSKFEILKIRDGSGRDFEKLKNRHISDDDRSRQNFAR